MNKQEEKRLSKFLSLILRHRPEVIDIQLDEQGWAKVEELLPKMQAKGSAIDLEKLQYIVAHNPKKRFTFNADQSLIRANQGHSLSIDLALEERVPPKILYHGTAQHFITSILKTGLDKRKRHHVHLSAQHATAVEVGKRHGEVIVLKIQAEEMHQAGHKFYRSDNGVWLTDHVPTVYIEASE